MVAIPFPLTTWPGQVPQEGGGRLINCYAEPKADGSAVWKRVPGLDSWGTTSAIGFRGMQGIPGTLFAGFEGAVYRFSGPGAGTRVGSLSGTKPIIWARNNRAGTPDVVAVDVENGGSVVTTSSVTNYPDPDVGQPNSVCHMDGYFFFTFGNGQCIASGLNTTDINPLDFITAESNPDGLTRAIPFGGYLLLFGPNSCELWSGSSPNATGFPFNRVTSTPHGIGARFAISGHEDGFGKALLWVGNDNRVKMLGSGYVPSDVSPPDLDRLIEAVTDKDTLIATSYAVGGRAMWVLSSPTWTWEFNVSTQKWNERASRDLTRWRGMQAHNFNGQWLVGDTNIGNILALNNATQTEAGDTLRARLESAPVKKFPARIVCARADFDLSVGQGIATGSATNLTDPTVEISWSDDGGVNWSNPLQRALGRQSVSTQRVTVLRTGMTGPQGRRWRVDVSDPVHVGILGGDMSAELRAK